MENTETRFINLAESPAFLSVPEMGTLLGVSRSRAYELTHIQGFPCLRLGRRVIVPKDKLCVWIEERIGIQQTIGGCGL